MTDTKLLNAIRRHLRELLEQANGSARHYGAVADAVQYNAVPLDFTRWTGGPLSDAERMRAYRALARLEAAGKLLRVKLGCFRVRFSHVVVEDVK